MERIIRISVVTVLFAGVAALGCLIGGGCAPVRMSDRAVFQRAADSSVVVKADDGGLGSGTVVSGDRHTAYVLTCAHVMVRDDLEAHTYTVEYAGHSHPAYLVAMDLKTDLALVATLGLPAPVLPVARTEPRLYSELFGMGAPMARPHTAAHAVLVSKHLPNAPHQWQVTGFVFHGMSGGAFTNAEAELVCVPEAYLTKITGDNELIRIPEMGICVGLPAIRTFLHGAGVRL